MENRIVGSLIVVAVAIIALGSILMPVILDATAKTDTFTNDSMFFVDSVPEGSQIEYRFEDGVLYVDDTPLSFFVDSPYTGGVSVLFTEHIVLRYTGDDHLFLRGYITSTLSGLNATVTSTQITGTYTNASGTTEFTWDYTDFYGIVPYETNRAMVTAPVYLNADSQIIITGFSSVPEFDNYYVIGLSGSIRDGFTANAYTQYSGTLVENISAEVVANMEPVPNYNDLYLLDSLTVSLSLTDEETGTVTTATLTFTIFTAPYEVIGERAEPLADSYSNLIYTIPIVLIISILLLAVGIFIRSRY